MKQILIAAAVLVCIPSVFFYSKFGYKFAKYLLKPKTKTTNDEEAISDIHWDCEAQVFYKTRTYFNSPFGKKKA